MERVGGIRMVVGRGVGVVCDLCLPAKMRPGAAVNGRGEVTGLRVFASTGILPMCRDPAGPMSSNGELGLGPLPAVTPAAPEVTPVRNTVSLHRAFRKSPLPSKMWPYLDVQGETTRSRQEEEDSVILKAWQNLVSTRERVRALTFDLQ